MNDYFFNSVDIKVYPTAYRDSSANDLNATLNSEYNLNYLKNLSDNNNLNNYFTCSISTSDNITNWSFNLTLKGYHFKFILSSNLLDNNDTAIYAAIKTTGDNENYALLPYTGESISSLDVEDEFKGLCITSTEPNSNDITYIQLLEKVEDNWEVCEHKNLKLNSNEIKNLNKDKNITEEFDTNIINLDNTNGHIIKNGQNVEVPNHNETDVNYNGYVLSLDDNNQLIWRAPYDGSIS